jgi:hypothetical protein
MVVKLIGKVDSSDKSKVPVFPGSTVEMIIVYTPAIREAAFIDKSSLSRLIIRTHV